MFNQNKEYLYKSIKMSPMVCKEILIYLYKNNNEIHERKNILKKVEAFHLSNGGKNEKCNIAGTFKKAIKMLPPNCIENPSYGYWKFIINNSISFEEIDNVEINVENYSVSAVSSDEYVYFYYLSTYKKYSELIKEQYFPIKIGRTQFSPENRIKEQSGTALPEVPVLFMKVKTKDSSNLEKNIHSILSLNNQNHKEAVGKEWFLSNEKELLALVKNIKSQGVNLEIILMQ